MPKIITKLGLDKTRFILRLKGVNAKTMNENNTTNAMNYNAAGEHIYSCTQDWVTGAKHWKSKKGPMTHSEFPLDGGSKLYVARGWSTQAEYHFMIVEFNPSKLTQPAADWLMAIFQGMFEEGYGEFFDRAECSEIEIPLDVHGARMTDYLFFDTRLKSVNDYYEADGTLYLGSMASGRYITVYDKAKEFADKGGPVAKHDWLRIEPHLHPGIPATEIADLLCAFDTVWVIDRKKLAAIKHNITVNVFRNRVFNGGVQPQAAYMMATDRKQLLAGLQAAIPDWYDPSALWKAFPAAAHRVSPAGLQFAADSPHPAPMPQPTPEAVAATTNT